jgi:predicted RNA-binding protein (TIGR00451 family)
LLDKQESLIKIQKIADFQFGRGSGEALFPSGVNILLSKRTGRIRHVYLKGKLLVTLRPTDGMFSLTISGAKRLLKTNPPRLWVKVSEEAAPFIATGRSAFAKHVISADTEIRPNEEVMVLSEKGKLLAVGKAILTGEEMMMFKVGVAVKVRKGIDELSESQTEP